MKHNATRPLRTYQCSTCGKPEAASATPEGWVTITLKSGEYNGRGQGLGLVCSLACLKQRVDTLVKFSGLEPREEQT